MVIRSNRTKSQESEQESEKAQMKLVVQKPEEKRKEIANIIAEIKIKKINRQRVLGEAKVIKNEINELYDRAEKLSAECATGQIKLELQALLDEMEDDEDDLTGRVMDVSNTFPKKKSHFLQEIEDTLDEVAERDDQDDEESEDPEVGG